jgi:hypothetical protein
MIISSATPITPAITPVTNRERLWQHFEQTGNPMSYVAYRHQAKKDKIEPNNLDGTILI